jgi:hypothetical protein
MSANATTEGAVGKRNKGKFEPRDKDFFPTPLKAVLPLIPHLRGVRTFAEPCCGNGALVAHLESHGLRCVFASDIASEEECRQREALFGISREYAGTIVTEQDALALTRADLNGAEIIITNSSWKRKVLHPTIAHLARLAPLWSLHDQDWAATAQALPFMAMCSDILPIGRMIWTGDRDERFRQCRVVPLRRASHGRAGISRLQSGAVVGTRLALHIN